MIEGLHEMFGRIFREECVPAAWINSSVALLHKGGRESGKEMRTYRPVAVCDSIQDFLWIAK